MAKICFISDTHNQHSKVRLESGDIIIHAGDATGMGYEHEIKNFIEWYSKQKYKYKIYVPGNHDIGLEQNYEEYSKWFKDSGIILLNDESVILNGFSTEDYSDYKFKIHGSPITPNFGRWSFMRARGEQINKHWMKIPKDTDILVTHGPPKFILDEVVRFNWGDVDNTGCEMLAHRVTQVQPKIHVFGHIHEGAGFIIRDDIEYINASQLDERYKKVNEPIYRDLK
jgi:Icc-related predicted phosphoesterase